MPPLQHQFQTREIHLAAYMKASGATFLGLDGREFCFQSTRPLADWRVEHSNSCCRRVDIELLTLRNLLPQKS